jgi:hypothetical protein
MAAKVTKNAKDALGKVAAVTVAGSRVFEDGALVAATFHSTKPRDIAAAVGAPAWSTVRVLARSGFRAVPASIVVHPVMTSLLTIGVPVEVVAALPGAPASIPSPAEPARAGGRAVRMTPSAAFDPISPAEAAPMFASSTKRALMALRIYREHDEVTTKETLSALAAARGVPHLRHLRLALNAPPADHAWLFGSKLMKQLDVLLIDLNDMSGDQHEWFGEWYVALTRLPSRSAPVKMCFAQWGLLLELSRDAAGRYAVLDVRPDTDSTFKPSRDVLDQLTEQLPKGAVKKLRVDASL